MNEVQRILDNIVCYAKFVKYQFAAFQRITWRATQTLENKNPPYYSQR